ncbi:MAG TPA: nitroreductase family deazaflavin-dependent oxidoreductase [Solirubrobacteraceae bacterium]|nr:nitroreductase family deazaflavin-dependent oxidoreductase [Solirubrobacteraceae bacterium]
MPVKPHPPRVDAFTRTVSRLVATRPGAWFFTHVSMRIDRRLIPLTRGRVRMTLGMPSALLTHTGAKSGLERTTPILYFSDGDDVVLVASNGGQPRHPGWLHNLRVHPEVQLSTDGRPEPYVAREADGAERARLWRAACEMYPGFGIYQDRATTRQIPVVVCSPRR